MFSKRLIALACATLVIALGAPSNAQKATFKTPVGTLVSDLRTGKCMDAVGTSAAMNPCGAKTQEWYAEQIGANAYRIVSSAKHDTCLGVTKSGPTRLIVAGCDSEKDQLWAFNGTGTKFRAKISSVTVGASMCLSIDTAKHDAPVLRRCTGAKDQSWKLPG